MALTQPTYVPSADYEYQNAYIALVEFTYRKDGEIFCTMHVYKDEDVASKNPDAPMERNSHTLNVDKDFDGDKGSITMATIYAKLKAEYYPEASDC